MRSINSNSTEAWRIAIDAISNYHAYTSGVVPAAGRWLFTRSSEEGLPLLALHPRYRNDDYCGVTFLVEATRAKIVDAAQGSSNGGGISGNRRQSCGSSRAISAISSPSASRTSDRLDPASMGSSISTNGTKGRGSRDRNKPPQVSERPPPRPPGLILSQVAFCQPPPRPATITTAPAPRRTWSRCWWRAVRSASLPTNVVRLTKVP